MIDKDDLRASVGAGILSEAQAASLKALADSRRGVRENLDPGDEPFELFRGFNEIFIVVGLGILTTGWVGVVTFFALDSGDIRFSFMLSALLGAAVLWFLSEYFIRKRRMIAPAIALSLMFAANAGYGFAGGMAQIFMVAQGDSSSLIVPMLLATVAMLVYWIRFRVPFALAIIAVMAFGGSILIAGSGNSAPPNVRDLFLLSANGPFALITLGIGMIVFAIAMMFDMSDPHRVTRRAANGFWLHVVAAPALVNTLALTLLDSDSTNANYMLFAVMMIFAVIAIVIDRRSFLIAAISYIVILFSAVFDGEGAVFTVLFLGAFLVFLGARWEGIRARLLHILPDFIPKHRLPPSV